MILFHENSPEVQDDLRTEALLDLKVGPPEEPNEDEDLAYDDDDLGENTEVTPLGDDIGEDDLNAVKTSGPSDDDDDLLTDDDDDDWDVETEQYVDDEDEIVDITTSQQNDPDDDEELFDDGDDDDLLMDDDEVPETPLTDDDDDETWDDDDEDLLEDDDDLDTTTSETSATDAPKMLDTDDTGVSSRKEVRNTGRMVGHEPGIPGGLGSEI